MLYRDFTTPAALDAEYNARASIPDAQAWIERFARLSQPALQDPARRRLSFGPSLPEWLDLWLPPDSRSPSPVLVFVHGGYWRAFSGEDYSFVGPLFARLGFATAVTNYALCPEVTVEEITRQTRAALIRLVAAAGEGLPLDPARIAVTGHSAGGHLAAMAALTDWSRLYGLPQAPLQRIMPISGLFDLRPLPFTFVAPSLHLDHRQITLFSPQLLPPPPAEGPPALILWGGEESAEFQRQSLDFARHWASAGATADALPIPGRHHFSILADLTTGEGPLLDRLLQFLAPMR